MYKILKWCDRLSSNTGVFMKKYRLVEHTADIRLFVEADSQQELFLGALQGMAAIIKSEACNTHTLDIKKTVTISSCDTTTLLIDFLSEVLTLNHIHKALFCTATFIQLTTHQLNAIIHGLPVAQFDEDIKAVTYHEANIVCDTQGILSTVIVFDI